MPNSWWSPVEVRRTVAARRDEVFAVLAEPTTYPEWLVGAQQIRHVDSAFPEPGSEFHHSVGPAQAVTVDDKTKAVAVDEERRLVLDARAGPFRAEVEFLLHSPAASAPGSTEILMRERPVGPAKLLTPVLRPSLAARNRESLRRLEGYLLGPRKT